MELNTHYFCKCRNIHECVLVQFDASVLML